MASHGIVPYTAKKKWQCKIIELGPETEPRYATSPQRNIQNFADTSDLLHKRKVQSFYFCFFVLFWVRGPRFSVFRLPWQHARHVLKSAQISLIGVTWFVLKIAILLHIIAACGSQNVPMNNRIVCSAYNACCYLFRCDVFLISIRIEVVRILTIYPSIFLIVKLPIYFFVLSRRVFLKLKQ